MQKVEGSSPLQLLQKPSESEGFSYVRAIKRGLPMRSRGASADRIAS
jgi:hypothetical protein